MFSWKSIFQYNIGTEDKHIRDIVAIVVTASSLAKEIKSSIVDINKACSNEESKEDEHSCNALTTVSKICA